MRRRILLVDDEPKVLQGLKRMLYPKRDQWEVAMAGNGKEALEKMAQSRFDVLVTDMKMPVMNGMELVENVVKLYPQTMRVVLTGEANKDALFKSIGPSHQFLSKPCETQKLISTISTACTLSDLLADHSLAEIVARLSTLPSLPDIYIELMKEIESEEPSMKAVGEIIERDPAMTAKILQLANSVFFGFRSEVTKSSHAATLLGMETIRSLVLMIHVFSQMNTEALPQGFSLDGMRRHCMSVADLAKSIAKFEKVDRATRESVEMAGLLHDVGKLILVANLPERYGEALSAMHSGEATELEAEIAAFGASHAEIGAYLLGLWGLPDSIIQTAAYHHKPTRSDLRGFSPLAAVHVANVIDANPDPETPFSNLPLDHTFLESAGVGQIEDWIDAARKRLMEHLNG